MKGQYFSFDAIIASVIFALALFTLFSYWHSVRSFLDFQSFSLSKEAVRVSTDLFLPAQGGCNDLKAFNLGVGWSSKMLNKTLIDSCSFDDDEIRSLTKTSSNVAIQFVFEDSTKTFGTLPDLSQNNIVKLRRIATATDGTTEYPVVVNIYLSD